MTTINLNLTPDEEQQVKDFFSGQAQTLDEAVENLIHLIILNNPTKMTLPKIAKPSESAFLDATVDSNGTLILPDDSPEEVKEWSKYG